MPAGAIIFLVSLGVTLICGCIALFYRHKDNKVKEEEIRIQREDMKKQYSPKTLT
jgi:hypothetical protein